MDVTVLPYMRFMGLSVVGAQKLELGFGVRASGQGVKYSGYFVGIAFYGYKMEESEDFEQGITRVLCTHIIP
jgi:hypothetical protein